MHKAISLVAQRIGPADGGIGPVWPFLLAGAGIALLGFALPQADLSVVAVMMGSTLVAVAGVMRAIVWLDARNDRREAGFLQTWLACDAAPFFTTDAAGAIGFQNDAAKARFGTRNGLLLHFVLTNHFANPSAVLFRLQCRAEATGAAREDVRTRHGHTRLSVHRASPERFLWRLDEFAGAAGQGSTAPQDFPPPPAPESKVQVVTVAPPDMQSSVDAPSGEAFENLPVALIRFGVDGRMVLSNRAARDLLDATGPVIGGINDLFDGPGRSATDWLADVAAGRMPSGAEVLRLRRADQERFFQVSLRRTTDRGMPEVLAMLIDATALKTLEAQFLQSQKMQVIGQLAGGIAHDFNNLLTAISGHCDLLLLRHDPDDSEYADLVQIHQNANRAAALVGQLLGFSRKQVLMPERVDLHDVLADLTHLLNRLVGERVSLHLSHAAGLGLIRADKRQLEQVIMNLVVNARDAMPAGGTIRIETEAMTLTDDVHRDRAVVPKGQYAAIRVRDTGCGISPDKIEKVFEPFYTTKRPGEGTGLGLSMAYGIVKQSGGFIFCDSEPGVGSVFHLLFPVHYGAEGVAVKPSTTLPGKVLARRGAGVVLLVEDEAAVRAFAARALRLRGYTVLEADCAEAALETLQDPGLEVDLFVTDVIMPGMDGPTWVRRALETRPQARVIFVSGYAEDSLSETCARIPNAVFLPKPFSLVDLGETVHAQIG